MRQCGKRIQRKNYHLGLKWNNKPPPPPLWSAYTAVNIYFTLGQAQVYNISPGGGDSHMKQTGMLVGNFEFNP